MSDLTSEIKQFLVDSGFEIGAEKGGFSFVAQNSIMIVFVVPVRGSLRGTVREVLDVLAKPFLSKRFGPKTMDMFCIFVTDKHIGLDEIEACEQDIRVCRKVVVQKADELRSRLSFLRPLADVVAESYKDVGSLFWRQLERYLKTDEVALLRKLQDGSVSAETMITLIPEN